MNGNVAHRQRHRSKNAECIWDEPEWILAVLGQPVQCDQQERKDNIEMLLDRERPRMPPDGWLVVLNKENF